MTTLTMNASSLLRDQAREAREFLEGTMSDVTQEQAASMPGGKTVSIAANYAHIITSQDFGLHGVLKGTAPLVASSWAGKAGFDSPPPFGPGASLDEWARQTPIDLKALRQYAQAVYVASDEYLASLSDDDLNRPVDLSAVGLGQQPASYVLKAGWINNVLMHCGEISCLKGLQGAKGYPV